MRRWGWFVLALCLLAGPSVAADYPTRPVTIIVPFPPGGGVDPATITPDNLRMGGDGAQAPDHPPVGADRAGRDPSFLQCAEGTVATEVAAPRDRAHPQPAQGIRRNTLNFIKN